MYRTLQVANFRGLHGVNLPDLGRVNLFVGPNNVGKTSLLEASWLFQGPGAPNLTLSVGLFRGLAPLPLSSDLLWPTLFRDQSPEHEIEIDGEETNGDRQKLRIRLRGEPQQKVAPSSDRPGLGETVQATEPVLAGSELVYEYSVEKAQPAAVRRSPRSPKPLIISLSPEGLLHRPPSRLLTRPQCIYLSTRQWPGAGELAERFTQVQDAKRLPSLVSSLQELEPSLTDLTLGFTDGQPRIRGSVGTDKPVPLQVLGGGMVKLTEVLLALLTSTNGLVLVDEIENGLYHRNLVAAWKAIESASKSTTCQIFATTHSLECVRAALEAFGALGADAFRLHRLERKKLQTRVVTYDYETALTAIDMGLEVR